MSILHGLLPPYVRLDCLPQSALDMINWFQMYHYGYQLFLIAMNGVCTILTAFLWPFLLYYEMFDSV